MPGLEREGKDEIEASPPKRTQWPPLCVDCKRFSVMTEEDTRCLTCLRKVARLHDESCARTESRTDIQ